MGVKGDKNRLGRALVRQHNHMIQESKEKGMLYRSQQKKVLESITEVSDVDAVMQQADETYRHFSALNLSGRLTINMDSAPSNDYMTPEDKKERQEKEEALHASSLRIPRRPQWTTTMSVEELDSNENESFLEWRRSLARLEENENLVLTPFEKNLDIWRQLWRVLERSDLLVMVVDARDPLFYRCPDLEAYAREIDEHKRTLLLVNKADLLPFSVREKWAKYFHQHGILFVFWSAKAATSELEGKKVMQSNLQELEDSDTKVYGRDELLTRLQFEAEEIVSMKHMPAQTVVVGFVGYPNVGKSSTINALVGGKKTGVTSTPGKTKHFQTLIISEKLTLCDCPGLVFPSFTSSRYEMIASGVLPIDRISEHREAVQIVANRVPRSTIENVYKISLPKPKSYELQNRPPLAVEFFRAYCASRGYVASSGLPDETKAARRILKDYIDGKLPHFEIPPDMSDNEDDAQIEDASQLKLSESHESDSSDDDEEQSMVENEHEPSLEQVFNDLNSFDVANGLASSKSGAKKMKKNVSSAHKQHKKPQRKKDRTWRVTNNDGDGMPVVRVFQKPVNSANSNA